MNIFFMGYGITPRAGGIEHYCYNILNYLSKHGHQISCYTFHDKHNPQSPFVLLKRRNFIDKFFVRLRITNFLKRFQPDRIICGHLFLTPIIDLICSILNIKYDLFAYGIECWAGRFEKYSSNFTNLRFVTSISDFTSQQIIQQGFPKDNIIYLPPVIDTSLYSRHLDIPTENFTLLTVGRLSSAEQYKGHDHVIQAMPLIKKQVPNVEYWIVGKGDDRPRLETLVQQLNLEDCVRFLGFVSEEDLSRIYAQSDVFIMPSKVSLNPDKPEGEGFGIVFLEAGISGKPLIGPNTGGSTDIIRNGYNGFNVAPLNPKQIGEAVISLAKDPELRQKMGQKAKKIVEENFSLAQLPKYIQPLLC